MIILAIETSCDDTCVAIVGAKPSHQNFVWCEGKLQNFKILSNIVSSQVEVHKKYGGVYPSLAKREHQKNLPIILKKVLKKRKIDLIAVTIGPGLEPCLWVGVNFAKALAQKLSIPIVPVNHIEAHILVNLPKIFPAVCLVVSGGHTQLILMRDIGKYKILGETRDDAAGECFDKTARILGLGYPGGPAIAKEAKFEIRNSKFEIPLPRPMLNQKNYDFSFSGLKTAVLYSKDKKHIPEMCKEIQQAIIDVLIKKTIKAAKDYRAKTIILGGGVASNNELRKQFKKKFKNVIFPAKKFCTDNAVMTAISGYYNLTQLNCLRHHLIGLNKKTKNWKKIKANANIRI